MKKIELNIDEALLEKIQEVADHYEQSINELFVSMAERRVVTFETSMRAIADVSDEDIEFLFNNYPDDKHPNPNNMAKITSIFQT